MDGADLVRPFIPQLLKYIGQTVRANLKKEKLKSSLHMEFAVLSKLVCCCVICFEASDWLFTNMECMKYQISLVLLKPVKVLLQ